MKACPHCGATMAQVMMRCPECKQSLKGQLGELRDVHDENLGFKRETGVMGLIVTFLVLAIIAAIFWFLR